MVGGLDSNSSANIAERSGPILAESIGKKKRLGKPSSLDLMEAEINAQVRELPRFASELNRERGEALFDPRETVFTGSGDSYATSLFAHYLSRGLASSADPYDLFLDPELCRKKIVHLVSVSGRTRANVKLAKRLKKIARDRVAITANLTSPLAKECDKTILLPYRNPGTITPGTISFTLSLLAVASMVRPLSKLQNLDAIHSRARTLVQKINTPLSSFSFIGTEIGYSLAAYASFKIHEVLGRPAEYEHTEQMGHSKLFSLRRTDNIVCFASEHDAKALELSTGLRKAGLRPNLITLRSTDPVLGALEGVFTAQFLALNLARRAGLNQVAFLKDRRLLGLSSRLIY